MNESSVLTQILRRYGLLDSEDFLVPPENPAVLALIKRLASLRATVEAGLVLQPAQKLELADIETAKDYYDRVLEDEIQRLTSGEIDEQTPDENEDDTEDEDEDDTEEDQEYEDEDEYESEDFDDDDEEEAPEIIIADRLAK